MTFSFTKFITKKDKLNCTNIETSRQKLKTRAVEKNSPKLNQFSNQKVRYSNQEKANVLCTRFDILLNEVPSKHCAHRRAKYDFQEFVLQRYCFGDKIETRDNEASQNLQYSCFGPRIFRKQVNTRQNVPVSIIIFC